MHTTTLPIQPSNAAARAGGFPRKSNFGSRIHGTIKCLPLLAFQFLVGCTINTYTVNQGQRTAPTPPVSAYQNYSTSLCLSGGGYRAVLIHVGALIRLNEAGVLNDIELISGVSGGAIVSAYLGMKWRNLHFDSNGVAVDFQPEVVAPLLRLARKTIDRPSVIKGVLNPFRTSPQYLSRAFDRFLFKNATIADLGDGSVGPTIQLLTVDANTGHIVKFSNSAITSLSSIEDRYLPLSIAVTASSAFPPVLAPVVIEFKEEAPIGLYDGKTESFVDGGVGDNLALFGCIRAKQVLVSDAGTALDLNISPLQNWISLSVHIAEIMHHKIQEDLRSEYWSRLNREYIRDPEFLNGLRPEKNGAMWSLTKRGGADSVTYSLYEGRGRYQQEVNWARNGVKTNLRKFPVSDICRLVDLGYAKADAALRLSFLPPESRLPTPVLPSSRLANDIGKLKCE